MTPAETIALCDEADRLSAAATPEPWDFYDGWDLIFQDRDGNRDIIADLRNDKVIRHPNASANGNLIKFSRTALPALSAAVRRLSEENERTSKIVSDCLRAMPCGNIKTHTPENLAGRIADIASELARASEENERLRKALKELIQSASPHPQHHPAMYQAWKNASTALASLTQPESGE